MLRRHGDRRSHIERSVDRILTTHTGSLPRPLDLVQALIEQGSGESVGSATFEELVSGAVADVIAKQIDVGVDVVNDGEQGKSSYLNYLRDRVGGLELMGDTGPFHTLDERDFPEHAAIRGRVQLWQRPACTGPLVWKDPDAVHRDIANLTAALRSVEPTGVFMTAASPGAASQYIVDRYYGTEEAYVFALADLLKYEYDAIHQAGLVLQLDGPDLAGGRSAKYADQSDGEFIKTAEMHIEALNHAVRDIPADRMRLHVCWGNYEGPHVRDVPLADLIGPLLRARPAGLSVEGANPRHAHEWQVFERVKLPDGKMLIPGVLDSTTNFVEHPELVKQRIVRYAEVVGRENVIAGTDCGFGTAATLNPMVDPRIAWAKLEAMAEGARLASDTLW